MKTKAFDPTPPPPPFADDLLRWFADAMRPLPWRRDYTPYSVWISEIMLQQTQMDRGVRYYTEWMRLFPDISAVARADEEAILAAWEGLGYYSRARNLHAAAKKIMAEHQGDFPRDPVAIRALPGVGEYTAGAIAAIAFNLPEPAVDANVLRVFARVSDIADPVGAVRVRFFVTQAVRDLTPRGEARHFCQALMELGALVCAKTARCDVCPVASHCLAFQRGTVAERPVKTGKTTYNDIVAVAGVVVHDGRAFIAKRPPGGLWGGLWEFPGRALAAGEEAEATLLSHLSSLGLTATTVKPLGVVRHGYTVNRVSMHGYVCRLVDEPPPPAPDTAWVGPEDAAKYAFPAGHRKLLERLGWK